MQNYEIMHFTKFYVISQEIYVGHKLSEIKIFHLQVLKVTKQAASCSKHRRASSKLLKSHLSAFSVKKMCWETCELNTSGDGRQHGMSACCCKNKNAIEFLTVTSSRECRQGFSAKLGNFLVTQHAFMIA